MIANAASPPIDAATLQDIAQIVRESPEFHALQERRRAKTLERRRQLLADRAKHRRARESEAKQQAAAVADALRGAEGARQASVAANKVHGAALNAQMSASFAADRREESIRAELVDTEDPSIADALRFLANEIDRTRAAHATMQERSTNLLNGAPSFKTVGNTAEVAARIATIRTAMTEVEALRELAIDDTAGTVRKILATLPPLSSL